MLDFAVLLCPVSCLFIHVTLYYKQLSKDLLETETFTSTTYKKQVLTNSETRTCKFSVVGKPQGCQCQLYLAMDIFYSVVNVLLMQ